MSAALMDGDEASWPSRVRARAPAAVLCARFANAALAHLAPAMAAAAGKARTGPQAAPVDGLQYGPSP